MQAARSGCAPAREGSPGLPVQVLHTCCHRLCSHPRRQAPLPELLPPLPERYWPAQQPSPCSCSWVLLCVPSCSGMLTRIHSTTSDRSVMRTGSVALSPVCTPCRPADHASSARCRQPTPHAALLSLACCHVQPPQGMPLSPPEARRPGRSCCLLSRCARSQPAGLLLPGGHQPGPRLAQQRVHFCGVGVGVEVGGRGRGSILGARAARGRGAEGWLQHVDCAAGVGALRRSGGLAGGLQEGGTPHGRPGWCTDAGTAAWGRPRKTSRHAWRQGHVCSAATGSVTKHTGCKHMSKQASAAGLGQPGSPSKCGAVASRTRASHARRRACGASSSSRVGPCGRKGWGRGHVCPRDGAAPGRRQRITTRQQQRQARLLCTAQAARGPWRAPSWRLASFCTLPWLPSRRHPASTAARSRSSAAGRQC